APHSVEADRGEYRVLQVGVHTLRDLIGVRAEVRGLPFPARCLSTGGTDALGRPFTRAVQFPAGGTGVLWFVVDVPEAARPGRYEGEIAVRAEGPGERVIPLELTVGEDVVADHGTGHPERLARLRWLDSELAHDDEVTPPFTPVVVDARPDGRPGAAAQTRL